MALTRVIGTNLGKAVHKSVAWRSGGQALPGLIVESVLPSYTAKMLSKLPEGVIIITGTNGKTTTTKVIVELLSKNGKKVLTNSTGSNMTRGIASGVIRHAKASGHLPYDIAVIEVDEASLKPFVKRVKPRWVLGLNVSRDQLDRFGEVDYVAKLIDEAFDAAKEGIVVNANDKLLLNLSKKYVDNNSKLVKYFSVAKQLENYFPDDYNLASVSKNTSVITDQKSVVELSSFSGNEAKYLVANKLHKVSLQLTGQHNFQNVAGALALCLQIMPSVPINDLLSQLSTIQTAFGRGECFEYMGSKVELVLVKNPASFNQALNSYITANSDLMIVINDNIADGRDTSWLWDVSFIGMKARTILTGGTRADDMALRLSYDDISVSSSGVDWSIALKRLTESKDSKKYIFATYTAMMAIYKELSQDKVTK